MTERQPRTLPSVLGTWTLTIVRALDARGFDGRALARRAGIDPATLDDVNSRYPITVTSQFWRLAVEVTGDPCFGLWASRFVTRTTFHGLGYAVFASQTIYEAFERLVRYGRFVSDAVEPQLCRAGTHAHYRLVLPKGESRPCAEAIDAILAVVTRTARMLSGGSVNPVAVRLERPEPSPSAPFRKVFRAPVSFAQPENVLKYAATDLDAPLEAANPDLARHNDVVVEHYLDATEACVARRLRSWLVDALPAGDPSQATAARALGMSLRNLQRRLQAEETTYRDVLSSMRQEIARAHLHEGRASVTEIAFLLGFADTCSFSRAFHRWTGLSPRAYCRERARSRVA